MAPDTSWPERYRHALVDTFGTPGLLLERGDGCHVWDSDGRRYLDFLAGIAVNSLGHAHPALVAAVSEQIARLAHVSNYFTTAPQIDLAERLVRLTGAGEAGRVFFANSGTEANEAAFKLARLHGRADPSGVRTRVLALEGSFHGRTMGALSITGKPALREAFAPMTPGAEFVSTSVEALEQAVDETVAAVFVEPIKGEAGVLDVPEGFLAAAREVTARHGALLIVDEIQTGLGRTGDWFGFQHEGITPDAITLAKGLAGGVPIGALVTFGDASGLFHPGQHGTTFGGNTLATAAGRAVLTVIEDSGLVENAARRGEQLRRGLGALDSPLLGRTSGRGLLIGQTLTAPVAKEAVAAGLRHGLIINAPTESRLRLAPPLTVGDAEIDEFFELFAAVLDEVGTDATGGRET